MGLLSRIARGEGNIDVVGRARTWALASGIVLIVSVVGLLGRGLNLGQEFEGGTSFRATATQQVTVADVEDALEPFGLEDVKVQLQSKPDPDDPLQQQQEILVRSAHIEDRELFVQVQSAIAGVAGLETPDGRPDVDEVSIDDVGPTWGRQVSSKALQGLIIFLILVMLYISLRFEWKMAIGALVALFHDLLATAGLYALVGFVVTPATVIALLTLLGYSLYDTVVVFDKIQENGATLTAQGGSTYSQMVNDSTNQVMMRSINTSLSTMLPIGSLLFVGVFIFKADTLKDLALAMFIGTVVGTYSSIFVAAPLLAKLKEREPRYRALRERGAERRRRRVRSEPTPAASEAAPEPSHAPDEPSAATATATEEAPARRPRPSHQRQASQSPRPRKRKRGKRRK